MGKQRAWRPQLTGNERRQGWIFFALYLLVFPVLLPLGLNALDGGLDFYFKSAATANMVYYFIITALLLGVFWTFLKHGATLFLDWLPENLFAIGTGFLGGALLSALAFAVPLPVALPILKDYPEQFLQSAGATVAVVVVLRPLVEEVLFRGLLFGSLRKKSRLLAYLLSAVLFALCSVWQFAVPNGGPAALLLILRYLPMGLALSWCYDNGGSVLSPMILHMLFSGISLAAILH